MFPMIRTYTTPQRRSAHWQLADDWFRPLADIMNASQRANVRETDDAYLFDTDMPGFSGDEIEVTVQDSVLAIKADHKAEDDNGFASRSISRNFTLDGIDEESISAQYINGILRITLPKRKEQDAPGARRIAVQ
ncbi:MAG: Hsp20/alpha crystallin family protein [Clostridia bacterium]|nr:Hsp20/alpha crystallin family protein [Clostridia bacterium]